jgi:predicted component of type VI protein secretion system
MTGFCKMRRLLLFVVFLLVGGVGHASAQPALQCSGNQKAWVVADLLFGREHVSELRWSQFVATELTHRFPDGFTVLDARGQWRAPGSIRIARERSKVVTIAMPPGADNDTRLQAVIDAYKTRFRQQSVGLIVRPACVSF